MRALLLLLASVCATAPALAITAPLSGAVPAPETLSLSWPFAPGEAVYLLSGYSPSGGSSLHDGTDRTGSANDYYALDLTLEERANHGKGEPVLAAAAGVVVKAGWASSGWANYGQRVILEHDPGDGHRYVTLYAHLDRIDVQEGDTVARGQPIGALGQSCQGALSCSSFGTPHLHFAVHQDSSIGGSGTGGSYGGHAVVPELIDGAVDLQPGDVHTSHNGGEPVPPPPPDPACVLSADAELVVEEDGPCAVRRGPADYWHEEAGHGGASLWTYTIADATADNSVRWSLQVESAMEVALSVVIPAAASSAQARYRIQGEGLDEEVVLDQGAHAGQVAALATVSAQAGPLTVELADNTGEAYTTPTASKRIAFDALIARLALEEPPPEEPPPEEPPPEEPPPEEPPGSGPGADEPLDPSVTGDGCAATPVGTGALALLLLLALGRRRRVA